MDKLCKYEIVTGWYTSGSWCEGSQGYKTLEEVIKAVKIRAETTNIVRVCITCDYSNSLDYRYRDNVVNELERELMEKLRFEI